MKFVWIYLFIVNVFSFSVYGIDKINSIANKRRVRERNFFFYSFIGGCFGSILGMFVFHHKTRKIKFYFLNFLFLFIWLYFILRLV